MTVKLAHIKWRDGRPRLVHGPEDGARGFVDRDLKGDDGAWFTYEQAGQVFGRSSSKDRHGARRGQAYQAHDARSTG